MSILRSGRRSSTANARDLRKDQTPAEAALWQALRHRRFKNYKFRRQQPMGPYIADFLCVYAQLIIEADGKMHDPVYDTERDRYLSKSGYRVLRFSNDDIYERLNLVLDKVQQALRLNPSPGTSCHPLLKGEGR